MPKKAPASSWYALIVLIIATILGAVDKIVLTLLTEPIRQTMSLSDTQIGLLQGAGLVLFTGLATLPLGWLSDRYDRRIVLAACIILWSAATGLRGTAETYGVLFIASIGLGMGEAGLTPITNGLIPDLFPRAQRVLANTIFALSTIFGAALGAFLGGTVVKQTENLRPFLPEHMASMEAWRLTFFVMAVVGVPIALLVLSIRKTERRGDEPLTPETKGGALPMDAYTAPAAPTGPLVSFGDHLRNNWRALSGLVIGFGLASIGQAAIGSWVPILAARKFGATPAEVGQGLGLAFLCGTVVGGFIGFFAIRLAQKYLGQAAALRVMMVGNLITACLSVLLLFVTSATQAFILMSMMVVPLISGAIAMPNVMQDSGPAHLRSRTIAVLTMASLPFGVLGPLAVGMLSDSMKDSPNGLAMAVVCTTLVGGVMGAFVLKAAERPFTKLMRSSQAANAATTGAPTTTTAAA